MLGKKYTVVVLALVVLGTLLIACAAPTQAPAPQPPAQQPAAQPTAAPQPTEKKVEAAPATAAPAAAAADKGCGFDVTIGSNGDAKIVNPILIIDSDGIFRSDMMFDSLVDLDLKTLAPIPHLAKSWDVSPDGTTYTFHLTDANVRWHDGQPFNVKDIEFTLMQILSAKYTGPFQKRFIDLVGADQVVKGGATSLEGFKIVDDKTVQFKLNKPNAAFLAIAINDLKFLPEHLLKGQEITENMPYSLSPVGTGPYKFVKWDKGSRFVMEWNQDYWGQKPCAKTITTVVIPDMQALAAAIEAGNIDMTIMVPPTEVARLAKVKGLQFVKQPSVGPEALVFNLKHPVLKEAKVRQAIAAAIDAKAFTENVLMGTTDPANGHISNAVWAWDQTLKVPEYSVDKAKQLLSEAGYANGFKVTLKTNQGNFFREHFVEYAQAELAKVGIQVEVQKEEWGQFAADYRGGKYDLAFVNQDAGVPDPDSILPVYHSGDPNNVSFYTNPDVDKLLEDARAAKSIDERKTLYSKAVAILNQDLPNLPVFWRPNPLIASDKFTDITPSVLNAYGGIWDWHLKQ